MELVDQHTKKIMEGCKQRALDAGLRFSDETLEYIVSNKDLLELTPKIMIPNLYDYWVHDVEVLKEKGRYELYPNNPYETVINTRPAISFYNDNNPDWMNVMIFYHVLAHIDFFQNNLYFRHTWDYDFNGSALSDKRMIAKLRAEKGRWLDYIIEFSRGMDNLAGYYEELSELNRPSKFRSMNQKKLDFYLDIFLQETKKVTTSEYIKEVKRYNKCVKSNKELGEKAFFGVVLEKYGEFNEAFKKFLKKKPNKKIDLLQYIMRNSEFIAKEKNNWMKPVMEVVRKTSIFFQPQIRTKILNEGWASHWHEKLFLEDSRIEGHEIDFARTHAGVTSMPRVGLNPYALGMRLLAYVEKLADTGKYSMEYRHQLLDTKERELYDTGANLGHNFKFKIRENYDDFMFINSFVDQDFVNEYKLFVAGRRLNQRKGVWEYYVKSRSAVQYKQMVLDTLYHPPCIEVDAEKTESDEVLYLTHRFEGKPLVRDFIANTMLGIEYLMGRPVRLETSEVVAGESSPQSRMSIPGMPAPVETKKPKEIKWQRVVYTMKDRKPSKESI